MQQYLLKRVILYGVAIFIPLYAFATDWYIMDVDTTFYSGVYGTSIALGSLDTPHIAYCRYYGPGLMYASWNPDDSSWIIESVFDSAGVKNEIDNTRLAGINPSLAFDSKGYPHISYFRSGLGYAWKDSLGWHAIQPNPNLWIRGTSLVLDKYNYPHIGYSVELTDLLALLLYTFQDKSGWYTEIVDTIHWSRAGNISLAIGKDNCIHIAYGYLRRDEYYYGLPDKGIRYGWRDENQEWQIEEIADTDDMVIEWDGLPSLALDGLGRPSISYASWATIDAEVRKLKYAVKVDSIWSIECVDEGNWRVGYGNFLTLDTLCNPHISYERGGWLTYALKSDGVWHTEKIDSVWDINRDAGYTGLVIDKTGYVHISYHVQLGSGTEYLINTKYATGYPEIGIEFNPDNSAYISFLVFPKIGESDVKIEYTLDRKTLINLSIYNIMGQKITELVNEEIKYGKQIAYWDSGDKRSGIYFCLLRTKNGVSLIQKIILIK